MDTTAAVDIIAAADTIEAEVAPGAVALTVAGVAATGAEQAREVVVELAAVELAVVEDVAGKQSAKVVD